MMAATGTDSGYLVPIHCPSNEGAATARGLCCSLNVPSLISQERVNGEADVEGRSKAKSRCLPRLHDDSL